MICGSRAVEARARVHPASILRLYFTPSNSPRLRDACALLAAQRRPFKEVNDEELERISGTPHHGGMAAVIERPPRRRPDHTLLVGQRLVLALDGVSSSHNLGALVRTAAFLGLEHIVLQRPPRGADPLLTTTTFRVAEGGMEFLDLWFVPKLAPWLVELRTRHPHVTLLGADPRARLPLSRLRLRPSPERTVVLVLGNEERGLAREVRDVVDEQVSIPGTGNLESLNVAHAAAIFLWELLRR